MPYLTQIRKGGEIDEKAGKNHLSGICGVQCAAGSCGRSAVCGGQRKGQVGSSASAGGTAAYKRGVFADGSKVLGGRILAS